MLSFWSDPHHDAPPFAADGSVTMWDAIARVALPPRRKVCRPLDWVPIIIPCAAGGAAVVTSLWGLLPDGVPGPSGQTQLASFDVAKLSAFPLRSIWANDSLLRRCLIPASGYVANVAGSTAAFLPFQEQPTTFAGIFCSLTDAGEPKGAPRRYSFGIITRQRCDRERFAHHAPVVIGVNSRDTWLKTSHQMASGLLGNAQPTLRERQIRAGSAAPV